MKDIITFSKDTKDFILSAFGKTTDGEGYVVEANNIKQRVTTSRGEVVRVDELAAIKKGSLIFVKSDLPSLIELTDDLK